MLHLYNALLLISFFCILSFSDAVCHTCFGAGVGCPGTGHENCPWNKNVAANIAIIGAASGAALSIASLLPAKLMRIFPKTILEAISALTTRVKNSSSPFDPTGKTFAEVMNALQAGRISTSDAILEYNKRIASATTAVEIEQFKAAISSFSLVSKSTGGDVLGSLEGGLIYLLFTLSKFFCNSSAGSTSFDLCGDASESDSKTSSKSYSANLVRPKSNDMMYGLLNAFSLCAHALGLGNVLAMAPFLEDVVFEPVRSGALPWFVAFECLVLYLRMIDDGTGRYNLANVVRDSGGIDSIRKQALVSAKSHYPATFFREGGGGPRVDANANLGNHKGDDVYTGQIKGSLESAKKGCAAWNLGRQHLFKHMDRASGKCKFLHKCDQFVDDKGPGGQCLGEHKRAECDYDPAHKVSQPVKQ